MTGRGASRTGAPNKGKTPQTAKQVAAVCQVGYQSDEQNTDVYGVPESLRHLIPDDWQDGVGRIKDYGTDITESEEIIVTATRRRESGNGAYVGREITEAERAAQIMDDLHANGVDVRTSEGNFAYGLAASGGRPGNIVIDPNGSISAIRHEYGHSLMIKRWDFPVSDTTMKTQAHELVLRGPSILGKSRRRGRWAILRLDAL